MSAKDYAVREGITDLIDSYGPVPVVTSPFDAVSGKRSAPFAPDLEDLVRIHKLIRQRHAFTVLEFGVGYSTLVIADALRKNNADWDALPDKPKLRNRFLFRLFSVDASRKWLAAAQSRIPKALRAVVHLQHSSVQVGTFQGRLCHFYTRLPDIVPDFIYLDGPAPKDVRGSVNGMSFRCDERTVMGADLLLMEPTLLPGTFVLVDGRTNNARFLERNFQRPWEVVHDAQGDITTFELVENSLGPYNLLGAEIFARRH